MPILSELCEVIVDCEHKTAPVQDDGYPSIRTPNIGRGYFILDGVNRVSEETYREWSKRAVPRAGDLIMAREAPVGNVAMIPEGLQPCLGQRTLLIRPDRSQVDPAYLTYLLLGDEVQGTIHAKTNGATVPHLNMKDVRSLPIPELPSLPTQRRIAGILSAYDELIANNQRRIAILEEMARALYREWFVHYRAPGVVMGDDGVPEGWEVKRLDTLCSSIADGDWIESKDQGGDAYRLVQISNAGVGEFVETGNNKFITQATFNRLRCTSLKPDDVLIARMPKPIGRAWRIGEMPWPMITSVDVAIVRTDTKQLDPFYFEIAWNEPSNLERLAGQASGTTRPRITRREIAAIELLTPPIELQRHFRGVLESNRSLRNVLNEQTVNLRRTRDLLLPRLMSGRVGLNTVEE